jgi:hypothetical protein
MARRTKKISKLVIGTGSQTGKPTWKAAMLHKLQVTAHFRHCIDGSKTIQVRKQTNTGGSSRYHMHPSVSFDRGAHRDFGLHPGCRYASVNWGRSREPSWVKVYRWESISAVRFAWTSCNATWGHPSIDDRPITIHELISSGQGFVICCQRCDLHECLATPHEVTPLSTIDT